MFAVEAAATGVRALAGDGDQGGTSEPTTAEVWITGLGLVSSLGEGTAAHWQALADDNSRARIDEEAFAPYPVHPLVPIDFSTQIPQKADQRQMGPWQRIGVHAAGLALADAGLVGRPELLARVNLNVAAGNGERDGAADGAVLRALAATGTGNGSNGGGLNEALLGALRPTLYLVELSNLLAGNISIVHGVTGSSRTFKGEEMAGVSAVADAVKRIASGQSEVFLVGGACNAERADLMLNYELCGTMWCGPHRPVWERSANGGGLVLGSVGAFLVLESATHASARGRRPYARITGVASGRGNGADAVLETLMPWLADNPLAVLSGASGAAPATGLELDWLGDLQARGVAPALRGFGTMLGHGVEAHFVSGVALAALAVSRARFYPPFDSSGREVAHARDLSRVLVTGWGHWRGVGLGLVEAAGVGD
jgi:3-oxoacyl-[acyl-carrier-protein] synthase II